LILRHHHKAARGKKANDDAIYALDVIWENLPTMQRWHRMYPQPASKLFTSKKLIDKGRLSPKGWLVLL